MIVKLIGPIYLSSLVLVSLEVSGDRDQKFPSPSPPPASHNWPQRRGHSG